jgi:glyoxylase-like metal-dependent hydrolase (beta-lactamase superfamily II)
MHAHKLFSLIMLAMLLPSIAFAKDPLELVNVTDSVYAIVGDTGNRSPENYGDNATFGFVVTPKGVVLIDPGGSYKGARKIHEMIKQVTDKPVVIVINTGGQDHRWLGNGYFKKLGAKIIANKRAVVDQKNRVQDEFFMLGNLIGVDGLKGTNAVYADTTFDKEYHFVLGGTTFEIHFAGPAHTPGDSFVRLPKQGVIFTGDIVFTERMLGVLDFSNSKSWIKAYEAMAAYKPEHIVPGHGHPTDIAKANADTYEYLLYLRQSVKAFMKAGGDITDINKVDQSKYKYLINFDTLAGRNAQRVYEEMEWE